MSQLVFCRSVLAAACMFALCGEASAQPMDDLCSTPKMKTDKWQARSEVDGMTLLMPPGYVARGISSTADLQDSHFYFSGEHRMIAVGSGAGPLFLMKYSNVNENSECETVIGGRRVVITMYNYTVEDAPLSASGEAGPHFVAVARFYATGARREVYVALRSNAPSDVKYFRQLFWTVSFDGAPGQPTASAPATATLAAATPSASTTAPGSAPPPPCAAAAGLPVASAVLDSTTVQMLLTDATPIPHGFEVLALQFDGKGELAGMAVAQTDLPEPSQRELSSMVASNLKPHDAHAPSTFLLRIDAGDAGLHYTILPNAACTQ